jgi:branched-chain amino acid transport system substrate-binding protein
VERGDRNHQTTPVFGLTRREVLKALALGGGAVAAAPVLAACGSDSGNTVAPAKLTPRVKGIKDFVPIDSQNIGGDVTIDMGMVLAFTGAGSYFGRVMSNGAKLAAKHIRALGGPAIGMVSKDHKSGDPQAGVQATKELGFDHVPSMLASYAADLGAMLPGIELYKIFTMDGGGGTSLFAQGKPFFWGMRAITPNDAVPGAARYCAEKIKPETVTVIGWDLGPLTKPVVDDTNAGLMANGMRMAGEFIPTEVAATDYSAAIQSAKSQNPDMLWVSIYGKDPGYFMKQYATSGIDKPVMFFEFTQAAADVAGSAYDGVYFAYDFFNADQPDNGWSEIFVDEYVDAYGMKPDFYAANYYEDTFALWECIQRALKAGNDELDGVALDTAFRTDPTFVSVYGGNADTAGEIALDLATHSVKRRPMTVSQYTGGTFAPLAYFNLHAADYQPA